MIFPIYSFNVFLYATPPSAWANLTLRILINEVDILNVLWLDLLDYLCGFYTVDAGARLHCPFYLPRCVYAGCGILLFSFSFYCEPCVLLLLLFTFFWVLFTFYSFLLFMFCPFIRFFTCTFYCSFYFFTFPFSRSFHLLSSCLILPKPPFHVILRILT